LPVHLQPPATAVFVHTVVLPAANAAPQQPIFWLKSEHKYVFVGDGGRVGELVCGPDVSCHCPPSRQHRCTAP
jgi:hypothetical protein